MPPSFRLVHVTTVPDSLAFFIGQVGWMKARGIEVHALSSPGPLLDEFGRREGIATHAVEMPRRISPGHDLGAVRRMVRALRGIRPHVVHSHTPKGGLLGMIAARAAGVPVRIYHIRGLPFMTATGRRRALLRWTEKVACGLAHQVLCVSHSIRQVAIDEGLCPPEKIRVLLGGSGNGVDATGRFSPERHGPETRRELRARLGIAPGAPVLGFVGRVVRDKGIVELAAAWAALREEYPDAHLLLVGPEEPRDPVPAATLDALRSDPRVHLTGQADAGPWYAAMDLLVFPSHREGFPNVPLEAAAMGLPVVATRIPGCTDAVADGD
ncbi:MAG: glycosyltransferase family 4 protein, partial [Gemmatimonadetes bacterium]|nr:glycosyltransferase family 4 protein [Gemmatimonadota bacterium]